MPAYQKPALSTQDMVTLLRRRGLVVADSDKAERYLSTIGYYRLSAYFIPFYVRQDCFQPGVTFDDILSLYIFDRKLRLLTLDPVQRIEIAVRSAISNHLSLKYSPFWMLDHTLFGNFGLHHQFIGLALKHAGAGSRHPSPSCEHYFKTYGDSPIPPSWMLIEELPMGCWSKLFNNLQSKQDKRAIARHFQFDWHDFASWLQSVTVIRNMLAHHRRFWNITNPIQPANLSRYIQNAGTLHGPYVNVAVVMRLLTSFTHHSSWGRRLADHMATCPLDIHRHMDFPPHWQQLPFWQ